MFAATFVEEFCRNLDLDRGTGNINNEVMAATEKKFPGVWRNEKKLELIKSLFLSQGADAILDWDIDMARYDAFAYNYLEQWIELRRNKAVPGPVKLVELLRADEYTLVSYFRKRIPCSCLDQKYKEVKSIKKMGRCRNSSCSHPKGMVERRTLLSCTRCRWANYCSPECQAQDWTRHKKECDIFVVARSAFGSKR
jgi:hypothetical protein